MTNARIVKVFTHTERQVFADMKNGVQSRLKELGIKKKKLADELGVSPSRLSMLLGDQSRGEVWSILDIIALQKALSVSIIFSSDTVIFKPIAPKKDKVVVERVKAEKV